MSNIRLIKNEQFVMYCILNNEKLVDDILSDNIKPFISDITKDLFESILKVKESGLLLTNNHILAENDNKSIDDDLLDRIRDAEGIDINNFQTYYKNLKQEYGKKHFQEHILKNTVIDLSKKNDFDLDVIDEYVKQAEKCKEMINGKSKKLLNGYEVMTEYEKEIEKRFTDNNRTTYGCSALDRITTEKAQGGNITIIFASSGSGKTTYIGHLKKGLINKRIPFAEFSTEMTLSQSVDRYVCSKYNIPISELHPTGNEEDNNKWEMLKAIIEKEKDKLLENKLYRYIHESNLDLDGVESYIKETLKEFNTDYAVISIDLLSMVKEFADTRGNRADNIENAMNKLNILSKKYNIHIIGTIQARREKEKQVVKVVEDLQKFRVTEFEMKSSSAYMERARVIITLFRPFYFAQKYFPENDPQLEVIEDIMELTILKQNQGVVGGKIKYLFHGGYFKLNAMKEEIIDE